MMDYDAIDRAMSRAVVRLTHKATGAKMYLSDNASETATDIPQNVKRFRSLADAWDAADRNAADFPGFDVAAVSVLELWDNAPSV